MNATGVVTTGIFGLPLDIIGSVFITLDPAPRTRSPTLAGRAPPT